MATRKAAAGLLALLLCILPCLGAAAPPAAPTPLENGAAWLAGQVATPGSGDELLVFALLRAGTWAPEDEPVQHYLREALVNQEDGGAAGQTLAQSAREALALSAAGTDLGASAPSLLRMLCDPFTLAEEGYPAQLPTLVLFGPMGAGVPGGVLFSPTGVARAVAGTANEDGGFGANGSNAYTTAAAMLALGGYGEDTDVQAALLAAQIWQGENVNAHGGFDDLDGAEDAAATAMAMLALDAMGHDPAFVTYDSGSMAEYLATFQLPDGSFAPAGGEAADLNLTVLCVAALAAEARYREGRSAFFSMDDVVLLDPGTLAPQAARAGTSPWLPGLVVAAIVLALALVLLVIMRLRHMRQQAKERKQRGDLP